MTVYWVRGASSRAKVSGRPRPLEEWVDDLKALEAASGLEVFAEQPRAARGQSGPHHQGVPERQCVQPHEIDRPEDVVDTQRHNIEASENLGLASRYDDVDAQFLRGGREILLENLGGDNPIAVPPALGEEVESTALSGESRSSV